MRCWAHSIDDPPRDDNDGARRGHCSESAGPLPAAAVRTQPLARLHIPSSALALVALLTIAHGVGCGPNEEAGGTGILVGAGAALSGVRVAVEGSERAGLELGSDCVVDLDSGLVTENAVGLHTEDPAYDPAAGLPGVVFLANDLDVASGPLSQLDRAADIDLGALFGEDSRPQAPPNSTGL